MLVLAQQCNQYYSNYCFYTTEAQELQFSNIPTISTDISVHLIYVHVITCSEKMKFMQASNNGLSQQVRMCGVPYRIANVFVFVSRCPVYEVHPVLHDLSCHRSFTLPPLHISSLTEKKYISDTYLNYIHKRNNQTHLCRSVTMF